MPTKKKQQFELIKKEKRTKKKATSCTRATSNFNKYLDLVSPVAFRLWRKGALGFHRGLTLPKEMPRIRWILSTPYGILAQMKKKRTSTPSTRQRTHQGMACVHGRGRERAHAPTNPSRDGMRGHHVGGERGGRAKRNAKGHQKRTPKTDPQKRTSGTDP